MARFWKWEVNPDVKAYLRYFSRGLLVTLAVLAVLVLIGVSFFYGDRRRTQETVSTESSSTQSVQEDNNQPVAGSGDSDQAAGNGGTEGTPAPQPTPEPTSSQVPNTGPTSTQMPNTGPRENAAVAAAALVLVGLKYRKSKHSLQAQLTA